MLDFKQYIKELQSVPINEITEHSKRFALETLLRELASGYTATNSTIKILHEPRRKDNFGAPDFKIYTDNSIIGYVENKKISENLDKILKSDQIIKYRELSQNILLTNYIDFVWIKGEMIQRETLCYLSDIENIKFKIDNEKALKVEQLIVNFYSQPPIGIANAKDLALALAIRGKNLKDFLNDELVKFKEDDSTNDDFLFGLYKTFKSYVFKQLTISEFSDAFAQMLVYGLFLAKLNADTKTVSLENAKSFIPQSFQLIKELVSFLDKLENPDYSDTKWIIDETISIMNNLDLPELKKSLLFSKKIKDSENIDTDPYIYFYETFLAAYDSKLRKAKGVYYTPPQVVNFIIRAVNDTLKSVFKISSGFADPDNVTVLDFATGTGTFLIEILKQIFDALPPNSNELKKMVIKDHILKNLYGFEYLIAPYTIAHLKLSQFLKENGYDLTDQDHFQLFLTNTLEPIADSPLNFFVKHISKEGKLAQQVKDKPILVITGNPPYSGHSKNTGDWITNLLKGNDIWATKKIEYQADYYSVDGKPINEKNSKWLQDDYVKFIRFAQYKIDNAGEGIVGIITNHSFLDNPTFKGMRQSLMTSFDQLYFIDLHGNTKKQEKTPEGEPDKNVFDIQQGVAISIMIKKKGLEKKVFHAEYFGKRKQKFEQLLNNSLDTIDFVELKPNTPFYLFIPQNQDNINKYDKFWQLTDVFEKYSLGVFTHRDFFLTDFNSQKLYERIDTFKGLRNKQQIEAEFQLKDTRDWKIDKAIKEIQIEKIKIEKYAYRPFDFRNICYNQCFYDRGTSRYEIMKGFLTPNSNLALNTSRMTQRQSQYCDVLISDKITDAHFCTGGNYVFPLYRYNGNGNNGNQTEFLFKEDDKKDNFTDKFRSFIRTLFTSKSIDQKYIKQVENNIKGLQKQYKQVEKFISSFEKSNVSEEIINLQKQTVEELKTAIEQKQNEIVQSEQNAFLNCIPSPEQILHYIYAILHSPTYRDKYAEFLKIDFPRIPFTKDLEMFGTLAKLGEQLVNAHTQIKVSDNIEFEKKINFLSDGDNIILKPEYFNNKLYINKTQYFEPIPETVYNYYIGGYQVLDKYIKDRKNREISLTDVETIKNIVNVINFTIHKMIEVDKLTNSWI